jgi:predicted Zn-dependent peptidase
MKHRKITISVVIVSLIFWLAESFIHRFIYKEESFELAPANADELWMRILIVALLLIIGLVGDSRANRIAATEREKREIFLATVSSTQHVLNNLLNQMQLVFLEAGTTRTLSDETRKLLEQSIKEGKEQIDKLSSVTEMDEETIKNSVLPT